MADDSNEIFHEVEEDLRQKELKKFWDENRYWIIGAVISAIVLTGGLAWWRDYTHKTNLAQTSALIEAISKGEPDALATYVRSADKSHAALARMAQAQLYVSRGERDAAVNVYKDVTKMRGAPAAFRDLAALSAVSLSLDSEKPEALKARLAPLMKDGGIWAAQARELAALVDVRAGDYKAAAEKLGTLMADPNVPADIRTRATTLYDLYAGSVQKGKG